MSQYRFPAFVGIKPSVRRTPVYATRVFEAISGAEQRISWRASARYKYQIEFEVARNAYNEPQSLLAFIDYHKGRSDSFIYTDPYDGLDVRVRFDDDEPELVRLVGGIWQVKRLSMISVVGAVGTPVDFTTQPSAVMSIGGLPFVLA